MSNTKINESKPEVLLEIRKLLGEQMPVEIKNPESYLEHLKLKLHPIHKLTLTIGQVKLPITNAYPKIKKLMREQELDENSEAMKKVLELKGKQLTIQMQSNAALRKAYGTFVNKDGEKVEVKSIFDPVKQKLIELFGRMFTTKEAHEICLKEWKLAVNIKQLEDFRANNRIEINKLIEEHKRTYSDIRLGHKRSRLEELVWLYMERKRIYETTKKADDHRLLLATLKDIKSEAEGDVIRIDGGVNININETVESHIKSNLIKTLSIKEIILSRVAARSGLSPTLFIASLNQSIYRNVVETEDIEAEVMPAYPSTQNYDFQKIRLIQDQAEREQQIKTNQKSTPTPAEVEKEMAGNTLKTLLLKKLSEKNGDVNYAKNTMSGYFVDKANESGDKK